MIRSIIRDYKKKIHGSEFDFHAKTASLEEHNIFMDKAEDFVITQIEAEFQKRMEELMKELKERLAVWGFVATPLIYTIISEVFGERKEIK